MQSLPSSMRRWACYRGVQDHPSRPKSPRVCVGISLFSLLPPSLSLSLSHSLTLALSRTRTRTLTHALSLALTPLSHTSLPRRHCLFLPSPGPAVLRMLTCAFFLSFFLYLCRKHAKGRHRLPAPARQVANPKERGKLAGKRLEEGKGGEGRRGGRCVGGMLVVVAMVAAILPEACLPANCD